MKDLLSSFVGICHQSHIYTHIKCMSGKGVIEAIYTQIHYYNHDRIHTPLKMLPIAYARLFSDNLSYKRGT